MPNPQVTDRIKEAPAVVLRAVFAGVGQLLMAADKIWAQVQEQISAQAHKQAGAPPQPPQAPQTPQAPKPPASETGNVTLLRGEAAPAQAAAPAVTRPAAAARKPASAAKPPAPAAKTSAPAAAKPAAAPKPAAAAPKPTTAPKPATAAPKPTAATQKPAAAAKPAAAPKPAAAAAAQAPAAGTPASAPRPAASAPSAPIPGYDDLSIASLRARLRGLDAVAVRALIEYEKANQGRDEVITMFERRLTKIEEMAG